MLENVQFRELGEVVKVDKVKVVACDGKGTGTFLITVCTGLTHWMSRVLEYSYQFCRIFENSSHSDQTF